MAIYNYIKKVDADQLASEITNTTLKALLVSVTATGTLVRITMTTSLDSAKQLILRQMVTNHRPMSATEKAVQARLSDCRNFGAQLMSEYATQNVLKGISPEQARMVSLRLSAIQQLMASGSLYAVLDELAKIEPDYWFTEDDIKKYSVKIKAFLGVK